MAHTPGRPGRGKPKFDRPITRIVVDTLCERPRLEAIVVDDDSEWTDFVFGDHALTIFGRAQGGDGDYVVRDLRSYPYARVVSVETSRARVPMTPPESRP